MNRQTHYATLHVDRCASGAEIKSAFRALAQRFHPDVTTDEDGERKFKDVAEAYRALRHSDTRCAYDQQINNYCADKTGPSVSHPDIYDFNRGLALFQYFFWFWGMNRVEDE